MEKIIGITGQAGFVGYHLTSFLEILGGFTVKTFKDEFFQDEQIMRDYVKDCDAIIHLAALNRHNEPDVIYNTNIELTKKLISALEATGSKAHLMISSSTQEERDNLYGKSKKESRLLLENWAKNAGAKFTGLVIPNVFGPFGKPFYNSFISTFSHLVATGGEPTIEVDAEIPLIYVIDLCAEIHKVVVEGITASPYPVPHSAVAKVTDVLAKLLDYKKTYMDGNMLPELKNRFEINLFNTFRTYIPDDFYPVKLKKHSDHRGYYVETMRSMIQGQSAFSTTQPGITRGNHFHLRKIERFCVIKGKASIKLRRHGCDEVIEYIIDGEEPAVVDMPIYYTHNLTNIGEDELLTVFWINEFYDPGDPDTFYEEV